MDARTIEKYLKYGSKYNLKTLEIGTDLVKIEFREPVEKTEPAIPVDPKVVKKVEEYMEKQRQAIELDELQIMNPEAFEEHLANADS
jgi:hypothetical protein